jgi:DNA polymerase I
MKPISIKAYELFHEGAKALADIEANGMRVDVDYCRKQSDFLARKITYLKNKLENTKEGKYWKTVYGGNFNLDSGDQLSKILFEHFEYKPIAFTEKGNPKTDEATLVQMDIPFLKQLSELKKYEKARNTYIENYLKETVDGFLHPFFHLNRVTSYRSSSSRPNFQNMPKRDKDMMKLIRSAIIPRTPKHMLGGADFSGIEVKIAYTYHKDPVMYEYLTDPSKDMHRDMAMQCYCLDDTQWTKAIRYCGKNCFVFPQFYGDYYGNNAQALWQWSPKLRLRDDTPMTKHLKECGFKKYYDFEQHLREVEKDFWERRFGVYGEWKKKWYADYCTTGQIKSHLGFVFKGKFSRNQVNNIAIQGTAFHCLLWCLIKLNKWIKKEKLKSVVMGQIHDEINVDLHCNEVNTVFVKMEEIMTRDLVEEFSDWLTIPMGVECNIAPLGGTWAETEEVVKPGISCDCGFKWLYKREDENGSKRYECPRCRKLVV